MAAGTVCAQVAEIFSGIQGEGVFVGRRQLFVRVADCNLACRYCDTKTMLHAAACRAETAAGARAFETIENPVGAETAAAVLARLNGGAAHHAVSFTGGEPLTSPAFIAALAKPARKAGLKVYLETNGTLPAALERVLGRVDIVAMDIKLRSATGERNRFAANREFLRIARRKDVFVKVVFDRRIRDAEIRAVRDIVRSANKPVPLVLQPVHSAKLPEQFLLSLHGRFSRGLDDVRIIPQTHKTLQVR